MEKIISGFCHFICQITFFKSYYNPFFFLFLLSYIYNNKKNLVAQFLSFEIQVNNYRIIVNAKKIKITDNPIYIMTFSH